MSFNGYNNQFYSSRTRTKRSRNKVKRFESFPKNEKTEVYDSKGVHVISGEDLCDCLDTKCDGCFFKCPNKKCKSYKCGSDCRQKRKFFYKTIQDQIDGQKRVNEMAVKCDQTNRRSESSDVIYIH